MKKIITLLTLINPFYTSPIPIIEVEETIADYEEYHNPYLGINEK